MIAFTCIVLCQSQCSIQDGRQAATGKTIAADLADVEVLQGNFGGFLLRQRHQRSCLYTAWTRLSSQLPIQQVTIIAQMGSPLPTTDRALMPVNTKVIG